VRYVAVNALPTPNAWEQGPNGEVYFRFYQYLPDIDQFVDTRLNRGIYPPEYLQANLNFLKEQSNPDFRFMIGLNNIEEEKRYVYEGLNEGLDRLARTQRHDSTGDDEANREMEARGSRLVTWASAEGNPYILGIPCPWLTYRSLQREKEAGTSSMELDFDPPSVAPYDVNRSVVRAFQLGLNPDPDALVRAQAEAWAGEAEAEILMELWRECNVLAEESPVWPLYGNQGFAWYRFWVRPLVPDIEKIPCAERAYYEDYMLTHFNNPHNIDLRADALWRIHTCEEMRETLMRYDEAILPRLDRAIHAAGNAGERADPDNGKGSVFRDLYDRLRAYRCYNRTLRNVAAWISGVHGYLESDNKESREQCDRLVREMVNNELENTRDLLDLWENTPIIFMPIHIHGEWMHDYGPNFGELLKKKIALMKKYKDYPPRIDPDFMWRLPHRDEVELAPDVEPGEYLKF